MLRIDDFIKSQIALTGWRYGQLYGQGGHMTACMVMSCLCNRVRHGWGDYLPIIEKIPQYAAEKDTPVGFPDTWSPDFMRVLHEVEGIYDGSLDYAKGGHYWCDLRKVETEFFKERVIGQLDLHPKIVDMNSFAIFV